MSSREMIALEPALRRCRAPVLQGHRMKLRAAWGLPGEGTGTPPNRFFDIARKRASSPSVDDRTWTDLEFPRIFTVLNAAVTPIGGQCLYRQLLTYGQVGSALARHF